MYPALSESTWKCLFTMEVSSRVENFSDSSEKPHCFMKAEVRCEVMPALQQVAGARHR
jgi:hypothetical protein